MTSGWRRWLSIGRRDVQADVDDELRFHIEMHTRDFIAAGMSPEEARREAERRFGSVTPIRNALVARDSRMEQRNRRNEWFAELRSDLRFAARTLRRTPFFTAMAVLCIGLGIGVTATIFSAVYGILLRPLPYPQAEELVAIYTKQVATGEGRINVGWHDFLAWRESPSFAQVGLWTWNSFAISGTGEAERLEAASVTSNLFPLLGVSPILGRHFTPDEEQPGRNTVILLGYGLWERRYGADRSIVGQSISLDGIPHTVVGVMPPGFAFPERGQAWVPYAPDEAALDRANRFLAGAIGRLRPGVTVAEATVELEQVSRRLQQDFPDFNRGWAADLLSLRQDLVGDLRRPLQVFGVAVAFVLIIACANVAGLMLTRGAGRARELAVRASLGAGRSRLVRQLLTESVMIGALGGLVGWGLAILGVRALRLGFPDSVPFFISLEIDRTSMLFTLLLSLVVGFLFGMLPALRSTHIDLASAVKEGGRGSGDGVQRTRGRKMLIVAEIALTMVLMIGAGLLVRSYRALADTELGFRPDHALTARIALPFARYEARDRRGAYFQEVLDRVGALPGVQVVGSANGIPFSGWNVQAYMNVEGKPPRPTGEELDVHYQRVTPGYFDAIETTIVRGRNFTPADRDSVNQVGIINEAFARLEFRGEDPVGRRVKIGDLNSDDPWITIVGVVQDFRHYNLPRPMGPALYLPFFSRPGLAQTLVVRTSGDPLALVAPLRAAVQAIDPDVPVDNVQTLEQAASRSLWLRRAPTQVVSLFAVLAMILAAVGLYGVIAYSVTQRTRELGVRMTLGATSVQVIGLVMRQAFLLSAAGIGLGLAGALVLTRFLQPLLHQVSVTDLATFAGVPLLLLLVTFAAAWAPARRAGRVDPVEAIKAE